MRLLTTICCLVLLFGACTRKSEPAKNPAGTGGDPVPAAGRPVLPQLVLLRTDLGLGDGQYVRAVDSLLTDLHDQGRIGYTGVGELPKALAAEAGGDDVGLPVPQGDKPGDMTLAEAAALLQSAGAADLLILTSGYLWERVRPQLAKGEAKFGAVLLLDAQGLPAQSAPSSLPLFTLRYDVEQMGFVAGVAAAESSSLSHFGLLYANDDPQAQALVRAVAAGLKYNSNGAWLESTGLNVGPEGYVTPDVFAQGFQALQQQGGPNWRPNHYLVLIGRSTPSVLNAISKKPVNAFVVGGYSDYRLVRPARVLGCVLKQPEVMLAQLLGKADLAQLADDPAAALGKLCAADGSYAGDFVSGAVGFTDMADYKRYNVDGKDIEAAIEGVMAQFKAGELQVGTD